MKNLFKNIIAGTALLLATASAAHASLITVSMTADNVVGGGLCSDATCTSVTGWATYGSMANSGNWKLADTVTLNLAPGTYSFAWLVTNSGSPNANNPAGLLAEISWGSNVNSSSTLWEIFNGTTGAFIANATSYGFNGQTGVIWTGANPGPIAGISNNAFWLYGAGNGANAAPQAWIRTQITVEPVSAPATGAMALIAGIAGLMLARRGKKA